MNATHQDFKQSIEQQNPEGMVEDTKEPQGDGVQTALGDAEYQGKLIRSLIVRPLVYVSFIFIECLQFFPIWIPQTSLQALKSQVITGLRMAWELQEGRLQLPLRGLLKTEMVCAEMLYINFI